MVVMENGRRHERTARGRAEPGQGRDPRPRESDSLAPAVAALRA